MSGNCEGPAEDEASTMPDWSVSGISGVSDFDPYRYHTEISSSSCASPENISRNAEIDRLVGSVRDLKNNLATISEKSVTPVNSPRRAKVKQSTASNDGPTTPPVKDPGLGPDNGKGIQKLEHMRKMLKDLEGARQKYASASINDINNSEGSSVGQNSQSYRRSLVFSGNSKNASELSSTGDGSKSPTQTVNDQFREMNEFLDRFKSTPSSQKTDDTIVEPNRNKSFGDVDLKRAVDEKQRKIQGLEKANETLRSQLFDVERENSSLRASLSQKDKVLIDLKSCWAQVVQAMTAEREEVMRQNAAVSETLERYKLEHEAAQSQFKVCQDELGRALHLADEFKTKIEEDERMKQDLLDQLLAEKASKVDGQAKVAEDNRKMAGQLEALKSELAEKRQKCRDAVQDKEDYEKRMAVERNKVMVDQQRTAKQIELLEKRLREKDDELKVTEGSMHTFYLAQMESLLAEKVDALQVYVHEWEAKMAQEKAEALEAQKTDYEGQISSLKANLGLAEEQLGSTRAVCDAARREADALREQLDLHAGKKRPEAAANSDIRPRPAKASAAVASSSDDEANAKASLASLPTLKINNKSNNGQRLRPAGRSSVRLHNNLAKNDTRRPKSAAAKLNGHKAALFPGPDRESETSILTTPEKRDLVMSFIKQFLEDNPEAVLNSELMAGLSEKANLLIDQSHRVESPPAF